MGNLLGLANECEIQLLVLVSFILQVFLFFTGSLRQRSTNGLFRGTIWLAYLGADVVAIYALGYLSRHQDNATRETHPLAFLWAPFLLIHLGGQDTITAFAIEDNNLWLRHLLNLLLQVTLALYVFWNSSSWHNVQLLVPGVLLFIAGIIKYGERTMALMYGNLNNNLISGMDNFIEEKNPQVTTLNMTSDIDNFSGEKNSQVTSQHDVYRELVCSTLRSAQSIQWFSRRSMGGGNVEPDLSTSTLDRGLVAKLLDIELSVMYNDTYTKATLLRRRSGIVLRCMSQISTIAALVIFATISKKEAVSRLYSRADIAITYTLFIGGVLLEVCAIFTVLLASPWTWWWLEDRGYRRLARISWSLVRRPETARPLWSGRMAQYSYLSYIGLYEDEPATLSRKVMSMVRKTAGIIGIRDKEKKLFRVSKLLDTVCTTVDDAIMEHVMDVIHSFPREDDDGQGARRQWHDMGSFLKGEFESILRTSFACTVAMLHMITDAYLSRADEEVITLAQVCRKLSNYMMYLVVAHPDAGSILQVGFGSNPQSALNILGLFMPSMDDLSSNGGGKDDSLLCAIRDKVRDEVSTFPWLTEHRDEVLRELRDIWVRLLIYAAGKSRPEAHVAQLARGGELLTFVWLLMAHCGLGDCTPRRVEPLRPSRDHKYVKVVYTFDTECDNYQIGDVLVYI